MENASMTADPTGERPDCEVERVWFDLFGHIIELRCPSAAILDQLVRRESCWKPLVRPDVPGPEEATDAVVEVLIHREPCPLTEVQHFSNENFFFHGSSARLITGYLYAKPWQVHVQSYVADDETTLDNMLLPALNNVLLRLGLVNVHCAAVARDGRGLLMIGPSRSGKSTTSLLLARAGLDFLSDNDVYLRHRAEGVMAMSSTKELFLLDDTATRFDDLAFTANLPTRDRGSTRKRVLTMDEAMPGRCIDEAIASTVAFPEVGSSDATVVEPMEPFECLERLLELVPARGLPALIRDQTALATLFEVLSTLSTTCRAVRVRLGRDPDGVVAAMTELL